MPKEIISREHAIDRIMEDYEIIECDPILDIILPMFARAMIDEGIM